MTLRRRTNKGGCDYANVSDNYNLLENAINKQSLKGGCSSFADVNSSYMLTDKKGGNYRSLLKETENILKKGGNRHKRGGNNLLSQGISLYNSFNGFSSEQPSPVPTPSAPTPSAPAPTPTSAAKPQTPAKLQAPLASVTGGKKGGKCTSYSDVNASYMISQPNNSKGGSCGCAPKRNGGAIELAPFAAAVALMAARYMTDVNDLDFNIKSSKSKLLSKQKPTVSKSKSSKKYK